MAFNRMRVNYIVRHLRYLCTSRRTRCSKAAVNYKDPPDIVKWNKEISSHMRNGQCDSALRVFNSMPCRSSFSYNCMISGYMRNGKLDLARDLFDKMPEKNVVSWNAMLSGYVRNRRLRDARKLFELMPEKDVFSWNAMLSGYAKYGYADEARKIFDRMPDKDSISWNGLLAAYVQNGRIEEACQLFKSKSDWDLISWNCLMGGYVKRKMLGDARQLFDQMPVRNEFSWNTMISGYAQDGNMSEARRLFDKSPRQNVITWNAMVSGYVQNEILDEARTFFDEMPEKDEISYSAMITGYVQHKKMDTARELFEAKPCHNISSWNTMIIGYGQNGDIAQARKLFDMMPQRDCVSWAAIIAVYAHNSHYEEALNMFVEMKRDGKSLNRVVFSCALSTCADIAALELGKQVHGQVVKTGYETGCFVGTVLLRMYYKCGSIDEANDVFEGIEEKDVVSWNNMISSYAQDGNMSEARRLFDKSPIRDVITWQAMVSGYAQSGMLDEARIFFDEMPTKDEISYSLMIRGYGQNGDIAQARKLFDMMPQRDCLSWAAIMACYAQNSLYEEALNMFVDMKRDGVSLDRDAFRLALSTCANIAALELGKQVHGQVVKTGYETRCFVGSALLGMYFKCGSIGEANDVFEGIEEKDVVSWSTMISGYARHGFGRQALTVFESMKTAGVKPDEYTMGSVLSACSHTSLIDSGIEYFYSMEKDYGVTPTLIHYNCVIDLLARAGRLEEAQNLMRNMPFEPGVATWGALLGASRIHGNTEVGEKAAEMVFKLHPHKPGMYVLLSNLYAASGRWVDASKMRLQMRNVGIQKVTGYSWVEVQHKIHKFMVGDCFHPEKDRIYAFLEELDVKMKCEGYVSSTKLVLHDVEEEEKEYAIRYHSEKLAVAFGILNIPASRPIRVMINLRVCQDCHNVIKHISKIVGRLIILRDCHGFHHFSEGKCSCEDYW